jgi:hypothetical protein
MPWSKSDWYLIRCPTCKREAYGRQHESSFFGGKYGSYMEIAPHHDWYLKVCIAVRMYPGHQVWNYAW